MHQYVSYQDFAYQPASLTCRSSILRDDPSAVPSNRDALKFHMSNVGEDTMLRSHYHEN